MRRFLHFWWQCAVIAARGNIAFANNWQWLFGVPLVSAIAAFAATRGGITAMTTGSPILDGLVTGLGAFIATWGIGFIVRFAHAPVQLYHVEKERADRLQEIKAGIANTSSPPSFEIGFEAALIDAEAVNDFRANPRNSLYTTQTICRIWVKNLEPVPITGCRVVMESLLPASSPPVRNGALLIPDHDNGDPVSFDIAVTETKFFRFLELDKPEPLRDRLAVIVVSDQYPRGAGFLSIVKARNAINFASTYFATIAVHGERANSRRITLRIEPTRETEVSVSEEQSRDSVTVPAQSL